MFVPKHRRIQSDDIEKFLKFWKDFRKILVLTGAGVSTESGIPDYRSEDVGLYATTNHRPMQYQDFVKSAAARKRYWARNFLGWPKMASLQPNVTHTALAELGNQVVTQNVDGLHTFAGSHNVVELHGSAHRVVCLSCGDISKRTDVQTRLLTANPSIEVSIDSTRPDGDVEIDEERIAHFRPVDCLKCGGVLKPEIVFFGDNVPSPIVKKVADFVKDSDALLVLGSSVTVFSSFRVVSQAKDLKKHVFIINIGPTRADNLADCKLDVRCSDLFSQLKSKNLECFVRR